jgi:transketolase
MNSVTNWALENNSRLTSLGLRAAYGLILLEMRKFGAEFVVMTADTGTSAGLDRFMRQFPQDAYDVGIAEQNMIGISAGMANRGTVVFASTFAPFQTARCLDQIRVNLAYSGLPVILTGLASGIVQAPLGYTHCGIEDLAFMKALPNLDIYVPSDAHQLAVTFEDCLQRKRPAYIRLTGASGKKGLSEFYDRNEIFHTAEINTSRNVVILSNGIISSCIDSLLTEIRLEEGLEVGHVVVNRLSNFKKS